MIREKERETAVIAFCNSIHIYTYIDIYIYIWIHDVGGVRSISLYGKVSDTATIIMMINKGQDVTDAN